MTSNFATRGKRRPEAKFCKSCKKQFQNHIISEENCLNFQSRLGLPELSCSCRENQKEPHKVYSWTPPGLPADKIDEYFAQLPNHKVPKWNTPGEKYREKQLVIQLPKQDLALAYCKSLDRMHYKSFEDFVNFRNEIALDIAYVREYLDRQNECAKCRGTMLKGDVAVIAPKFGENVSWHPACFVCSICDELLVDLTHCVKDRKLYCERHYAEQIKPRCAACDEYCRSISKRISNGKELEKGTSRALEESPNLLSKVLACNLPIKTSNVSNNLLWDRMMREIYYYMKRAHHFNGDWS